MPPMPIFPPEILRIVFEKVEHKGTLLDLLVTSRQFSQLVEPILYAQIYIFPKIGWSMRMMFQSLLEALETSNRRKVPYVRAFTLMANEMTRGENGLLIHLLEKMVNLKSLTLRLYKYYNFFQPNPTFALARFEFKCVHYHQDLDLLRLLESQPSLEMLLLDDARQHEDNPRHIFSPTSFPNLKVLSLDSSLVYDFLRASPRLTRLRVWGNVDAPPTDSDPICIDTVRTLVCANTFIPNAVISLASLFPNLEWLTGRIDTVQDLERLSTHARELRGIRFTTRVPSWFSGDNIPRLFEFLPALEFLDYIDGTDWERYRWYRDATAPTHVFWLCRDDDVWLADWVEDAVDVIDW
ncbi:hypothetical protein CCMSSC00406_0008801 [Pleurotus cornucopiae]|uniref:Uncharacterized protein n=1 Tax=Pleurotus cornucopiae TaxID=5321 RepID=A0ACB7IIN6_PLECO|nr:hypothetical protein CCMSSC00406_0008801 [Pleurotus cornucopiae]